MAGYRPWEMHADLAIDYSRTLVLQATPVSRVDALSGEVPILENRGARYIAGGRREDCCHAETQTQEIGLTLCGARHYGVMSGSVLDRVRAKNLSAVLNQKTTFEDDPWNTAQPHAPML